jgi:hypothetical protein
LTSCEELRSRLEEFRNDQRPEYPLRPIQRWMVEELGVARLRNTGGVAARFEHPAIEEIKGDGIFAIHLAHGRNREFIYRKEFLNYLYRPLLHIICFMEREKLCGDKRP